MSVTYPTNAFCRNATVSHGYVYADETVTVTVQDGSANSLTMALTPKSYYTYFDLAPIAKKFFRNDLSSMYAHYARLKIRFSSESTDYYSNIYRALPQLGESATYSLPAAGSPVVLSDFATMKRWRIGSMGVSQHDFVCKYSGGLTSYGSATPSGIDKPIVDVCIPDSPFLVRWLNLRGGCDYWCFRKPVFEESLKSFSEYAPYMSDSQITAGRYNREAYGGDLERYATVGSGSLTAVEAAVVGKIVYSPLIEYWNADLTKWQRITVKPGSLKYNGFFNQSLEVTFRMPDIHYLF